MITTSQFQERLIEYLDGELPEAERREVEEYLQAHPEAARLEGDLALLSEAGRSIRESSYPADLLLEANRSLAARLGVRRNDAASVRGAVPALSGNGSPQMPGPPSAPHRRRWRPRAVAAVLAAVAVLLAGSASQRAAIAEVAGSLLERIRVSLDGEQWLEFAGEGVKVYEVKSPVEADTLRIILPERGDTIRIPLAEMRDTTRILAIRAVPAGKTGSESPDVPAQSGGEVKESIDPKVDTSP